MTIDKGGEVTFQVHGGGHGMAILAVSKDTTRDDIGQFLCAGTDPETIANPADHACNLSTVNSDASHVIEIGHNDAIVVPAGTTTHPDNRVWVVDGRLMSAGGIQFLNGGTVPAGPTSNGQLDYLSIPQERPLPRPLLEPRALSQRLDVRLRQREVRDAAALTRQFAPADSPGRGAAVGRPRDCRAEAEAGPLSPSLRSLTAMSAGRE